MESFIVIKNWLKMYFNYKHEVYESFLALSNHCSHCHSFYTCILSEFDITHVIRRKAVDCRFAFDVMSLLMAVRCKKK